MELTPFVLTVLKWGMITTVLVIGLFLINRSRTFTGRGSAKKMSFKKRTETQAAEIHLDKSHYLNPTNISMTVTNSGTKEIDLYAPVITFKRWFSKRSFRILKVEHSEIYPILLEPGKSTLLDISLEQFYEAFPELKLACRMKIEMKDRSGKRYKSQTIRLKWF